MSGAPGWRGQDLEKTAARFDELYTEMTALQRELIAAVRGDLDGTAADELAERAETMLAAARATQSALGVGGPSARAPASGGTAFPGSRTP